MRSISGKEITYGGQQYISKRKFGKSQFIEPEEKPVKCDIANWNCFLIPQEVIDNVGIIDSKYEHGLGDFDYSLMMQKKGYNIYTSIGYIGKVDRNSIYRTYMDVNLKKQLRIKNLFSRKGRPIKSEFYFYIKHHGFVGFLYCIYLYIRLLIDIIK
jgi:GT2 family glycosyltransferase